MSLSPSSESARAFGAASFAGWAPALAAGAPLLAYVWAASAYPYWLDSAELTAAAVWLDVAHPPGHPLASLWGKLFTLLPAGPLPFRVALSQAVAAGLALLGTYQAIARTLRRPGHRATRDAAIALGATWLLAGTGAFFFQAVRAEVYATQAMLICWAMAEVATLAAREGASDLRPFGRATLALGLGLANHHFVAVVALPMLAWELARLSRQQGLRCAALGVATGLLGISTYAYLPLRALTEPPLDLGHPATFASFVWVVSGQLYAEHVGGAASQPLSERLADLAVLLVEQLGPAALVLALLGLYALLRTPGRRRLVYAWAIVALTSGLARAWLGPVRANPDVLGYLMPCFAALTVLGAAGFAALLDVAQRAGDDARLRWLGLLALAPLGLGAAALYDGAQRHGLGGFAASARFDSEREAALPPGALLIATTPTLAFAHWSAEAVEHARPDLTMLPVTFLNYPHAAARQIAQSPALTELVTAAQGGALPLAPLVRLASARPVYIEQDANVALPVMSHVLPEGLLYRMRSAPPTGAEVREAAAARERSLDALTRALGADLRDQETARQLLFLHYVDALYFAHHGARAPALRAVARGLALFPHTRELHSLHAALLRVEDGVPLELTPFLAAARE